MWMLRLKTGLEMTEQEVGCWDNIPRTIEIQSFALGIPRSGGLPPYIIEVSGYEEMCCGKVGSVIAGTPARLTGHVIFAIRNDTVTEFTVRGDGISMKSYPRDKLTLREDTLRRMSS